MMRIVEAASHIARGDWVGSSKRRIQDYRWYLNCIARHFGNDKYIQDITTGGCIDYINLQYKEKCKLAAWNIVDYFYKFMDKMLCLGIITENPLDKVQYGMNLNPPAQKFPQVEIDMGKFLARKRRAHPKDSEAHFNWLGVELIFKLIKAGMALSQAANLHKDFLESKHTEERYRQKDIVKMVDKYRIAALEMGISRSESLFIDSEGKPLGALYFKSVLYDISRQIPVPAGHAISRLWSKANQLHRMGLDYRVFFE
jgi:hypothetical protein